MVTPESAEVEEEESVMVKILFDFWDQIYLV